MNLFKCNKYGGIAQLGEHLLCKQGVIGSIPIISTKLTGDGQEPRQDAPNKNMGL